MKITVLKNKTSNEVDLGVDLEAVGVVSEEDVTRVVMAVLEVDVAAIGVGVGATVVITLDIGTTIMIGVVAEVVVVLEVVVVEVAVEVVSIAENLGEETGIMTDPENRGETMKIMIEEVLGVVSIKENLSISQAHLKIKESLLMINNKDVYKGERKIGILLQRYNLLIFKKNVKTYLTFIFSSTERCKRIMGGTR